MFIVLGWMPSVLVFSGVDLPIGALALMAAGGLFYSVGFVIFIIESPIPCRVFLASTRSGICSCWSPPRCNT
ncbi:hypothetical protein [Ornithinimicrobium sp. INDO-MA30-4]|uniref:hypothetical protein n=1 Tax=Ornithinimicrobium sp. INDO-MA30-4 TaxID=2908651 RepID=UPI001F3A31D8|nr:hypothetical protein [Ornithinimicrobium sp. INDO-MA30-4]UJH69662.1 hypothetical protein L0A91_09995 [Ornithinimicrobium sp. INDO-MA30-4]